MKSLKFVSIALALGFAIQLGCGSDDGGSKPDGAILGGTGGAGGMYGPEAGVSTGGTMMDAPMTGTGGMMMDAAMTGGAGGSMDGGMVYDAPMGMDMPMGVDGGMTTMDGGGEAGTPPANNICTGLSAKDCHMAIINAAVEATVLAQDPPVTNPPNYLVCSQ
jgi:hypothetical protein